MELLLGLFILNGELQEATHICWFIRFFYLFLSMQILDVILPTLSCHKTEKSYS